MCESAFVFRVGLFTRKDDIAYIGEADGRSVAVVLITEQRLLKSVRDSLAGGQGAGERRVAQVELDQRLGRIRLDGHDVDDAADRVDGVLRVIRRWQSAPFLLGGRRDAFPLKTTTRHFTTHPNYIGAFSLAKSSHHSLTTQTHNYSSDARLRSLE